MYTGGPAALPGIAYGCLYRWVQAGGCTMTGAPKGDLLRRFRPRISGAALVRSTFPMY